jgi:hypothetical protein
MQKLAGNRFYCQDMCCFQGKSSDFPLSELKNAEKVARRVDFRQGYH